MAQILKSKNLATKFQIMVEIAAHQPNIQQKDIAPRLGITSQAVSEYIRDLIRDGWLSSEGRSRYKVTNEGVDWILQMSRQLHSYAWFVSKAVADISTTTAIADSELSAGQPASLYMKDGLLFAANAFGVKGAKGTVVTEAKKGQDVGIRNIEGVIRQGAECTRRRFRKDRLSQIEEGSKEGKAGGSNWRGSSGSLDPNWYEA
jgi:putative transcriptional regulator